MALTTVKAEQLDPTQTSITSVGTLTGLASSGTLAVTSQVAIRETAPGIESGHSSAHSLQVGRWSGTNNRWMIVPEPEGSPLYSRELSYNFSTDTWAVEGDFAATLSTAAQPNITSVGTLTSLNVSGALTGTTAVLTSANNSAQLVLKSTDDDASVGPLLDLTRDSASPAANDVAGKIRFMADNDAGSSVSFGAIGMNLKDVSNGSEDGEFTLTTKLNGTNRSRIKSDNTETVFNDDSQALNFRVESNGAAHMLFVDASNNRVGIGDSAPSTQLHVSTSSQDDGITIECTNGGTAAGPSLKLDRSSATPANNDDLGEIEFRGRNNAGESTQYARILSEIIDVTDGAESGSINLQALLAGTARSRFFSNATETVINEGGRDLNFRVESDGDANMLFVDAGNNRIGIGTDSPTQKLDLRGAIRFGDTIADVADGGRPLIYASDGSGSHTGHALVIQARDGAGSEIDFVTGTTPTTRMHIGSSGNVGIGTTDTTLYNNTSGGGIMLGGSGTNRLDVARDGDVAATFNRSSGAGEVISFYQGGNKAGGLGVYGTDVTIGTGDTGITFEDAADAVHPVNFTTGAARDNAVDLGKSAARFKDAYLSGGVYLGGTGSSNHLHDYEEGIVAITLTPSTSGTLGIGNHNYYAYTKVGRMVSIQGQFSISSSGTANPQGDVRVNLPFVVHNFADVAERGCGPCIMQGVNYTGDYVVATTPTQGVSYFTFNTGASNSNFGSVDASLFGNGDDVRFSLVYYTT